MVERPSHWDLVSERERLVRSFVPTTVGVKHPNHIPPHWNTGCRESGPLNREFFVK